MAYRSRRSFGFGWLLIALTWAAWPVLAASPQPAQLAAPPVIPGVVVGEDLGPLCPRVAPVAVDVTGDGVDELLLPSCHQGRLKNYPSPTRSGGMASALQWERLTRACGNFDRAAVLAGEGRRVLWQHQAERLVEHAFVSSDRRRVVLISADDHAYGLDAATGSMAWNVDLVAGVEDVEQLGDLVVMVTGNNVVQALSLTDGRILWSTPIKVVHGGGPWLLLDGGLAFVGSNDDRLLCLDARTGEERWTVRTDGNPSLHFVRDGVLFIGSASNAWAVRAEDGAVLWRHDLGATSAGATVDAGDVIVAAGRSGMIRLRVFGLDAATGAERWQLKLNEASPARTDKVVYAPDDIRRVEPLQVVQGEGDDGPLVLAVDRDGVRAVDPTSGEVVWSLEASLPQTALVDGDRLYVVEGRGPGEKIHCLDPRSGKVRWTHTAPSRIQQVEPLGDTLLLTLWEGELVVLSAVDGSRGGWFALGEPHRLTRAAPDSVILCSARGTWRLTAEGSESPVDAAATEPAPAPAAEAPEPPAAPSSEPPPEAPEPAAAAPAAEAPEDEGGCQDQRL